MSSTSISQETPSPQADTSAFERHLGAQLDGMTNAEAGKILGLHPAWVPTRRKGKKWTFVEVLRLARHLDKTLGDLAREAEER